MSELKVYHCNEWHNEYTEFYLKSEVDALLAEKDAAIAELKRKLMPCLNGDCILTCEVVEKYGKENAELKAEIESQKMHKRCADNAAKIIRHQKYKRCLNMARLCGKTVDHLNSEGYIYEKENHTKELTDCIRGTEFYDKWYHRWLALAEKFKEAK